jgi:transposase
MTDTRNIAGLIRTALIVNRKLTADNFLAFLKRLIHNWSRAIFLSVDGHPVHKSVIVSQFVASTEGYYSFFIFPYSPELNRDEQVWNHLKDHGNGKQPITDLDQLKQMTFHILRKSRNCLH